MVGLCESTYSEYRLKSRPLYIAKPLILIELNPRDILKYKSLYRWQSKLIIENDIIDTCLDFNVMWGMLSILMIFDKLIANFNLF